MIPTSITQASIASTMLPRPGGDDAPAQDGEFDAVLADLAQGGEPAASGDIATPTLPAPTRSLGLPLTTNTIATMPRGSATPPRTGGADVHALLAKLSIGSDTESTAATAGLAAATSAPPVLDSATATKANEATDGSSANVSTTTDVSTTDIVTPATLVAMPLAFAASATPTPTDRSAAPTSARARPAAVTAPPISAGTGAATTADIASPSAAIVGDAPTPSLEAGPIEPEPLARTSSGATPLAAASAQIAGSAVAAVKVSVLGTARHLAPATQAAFVTTTDVETNPQAPPPALLATAGVSSSAVAIDPPPEAEAATAAAVALAAPMTSPNVTDAQPASAAARAAAPIAVTAAAVATEPMASPNANGVRPTSAAAPAAAPVLATTAIDSGATIAGVAPSVEIRASDKGAEPAGAPSNVPSADATKATVGGTAANAGDLPVAQVPGQLPLASGVRDTATGAPATPALVGISTAAGEGTAFVDAPPSTSAGLAAAAGASRSTVPSTALAAAAEPAKVTPREDAAPDALPTGTLQTIAGAVATLADEAASQPAAPTAPAPQAASQPTVVAPARSLTLQLSPGTLGAVTMHLHLGAGGLDVRLAVENDETRGAITRARDELAAAIGDTGSKLDSLTIRSADPSPALAGSNDSARHDTASGNAGFSDNPGRRGSGGEGARRQNGAPPREPAAARDHAGDGVFV